MRGRTLLICYFCPRFYCSWLLWSYTLILSWSSEINVMVLILKIMLIHYFNEKRSYNRNLFRSSDLFRIFQHCLNYQFSFLVTFNKQPASELNRRSALVCSWNAGRLCELLLAPKVAVRVWIVHKTNELSFDTKVTGGIESIHYASGLSANKLSYSLVNLTVRI